MLELNTLVDRVKAYHPSADTALLVKAYDYSNRAHEGQKRKSGEPYFTHPVSVAGLLTDLRLDMASVCAGLLHDVVEDTPTTLQEIDQEFGTEVAELVDGVTKLSKIEFTSKADRQAENFRKMVVAMSRDIRVLLVKLCDRLDNMRTLEHMKPEAQERIARETMDIYAPLANRLGMSRIKSELEDLSFRYLEPDAYRELSGKVAKTQAERERYIASVCRTLQAKLAEHGFAGEVSGRAKHLYSIYRKLQAQKCEFEQVYDIVAFRCILETVADCYAALGVIHSKWTPVPGRFKDYIALPKPNQYRSLHTTVIGPGRERIEIQTRTADMHRIAEQGIAAHWKYKERHSGGLDPRDAESFAWLRELMEVQKDLRDPAEFLESVKLDLFQDEVYVFSPKGDVHVFPRGATPVDFAYTIHTDVGTHCAGARVNGAMVPLRHRLHSGDVVEILTDPRQLPNKDWLDFAVTSRARSKIRNTLRSDQRERAIRTGRELLERELHEHKVSLSKMLRNQDEVRKLIEHFRATTLDELLMLVGYGKLKTSEVCEFLVPPPPPEAEPSPDSDAPPSLEPARQRVASKDAPAILLGDTSDILARYARCCNPLPGEEVVGFITRGRGITVHRRTCSKAFDSNDPQRRVDVSWQPKTKMSRTVQIKIVTTDRPGILATLGQTFQARGVNVQSAVCRAGDDGRALNLFTFTCGDLDELKTIMNSLRKVNGVLQVDRTLALRYPGVMFQIARRTSPLPSLDLLDTQAHTAATLAPSRGGLLTSLRLENREVLYMDEATLLDPSKNVRGGNPVLFPSPGKLRDDRWSRGGLGGTMKQHGFARNLPWEQRGEDTQGGASVTLGLAASDETRALYPFDFDAAFTYTLRGNELTIAMNIRNRGATAMPFGAGFHPYFAVPRGQKGQVRFETRATRAFDNTRKEEVPYRLDLSEGETDLHLLDHGATRARMEWPGGAVELAGSEEFTHWVLWTLPERDFVCLEPWTCPGDALNTGDRLLHLEPGASRTLRLSMRFELT
jgi:GTP pyrophosphokinase